MPTLLSTKSLGPVDVAVVEFADGAFDAEVASAILDLHEKGLVRIVDLSLVRRGSDGGVSLVEVADSDLAGAFTSLTDALDLLSDEDLRMVAGDLEPGTAALVVVWENAWASRMATAVQNAQGRVTMLERVPRPVVERAMADLGGEV